MYKITIKQGNIFDEKESDFIVNPSNTDLFLGSGVSAVFRKTCGSEMQTEMKKLAPVKQGDVVTTTCPKNPDFKYALHTAVMDYSKPNPSPTYGTIKTILRNIEKLIKPHAPCKIVLPLMGTGVGGLDKEKVIRIYKEFFSRNVGFECEVIIFGYRQNDYKLIKKIFNE